MGNRGTRGYGYQPYGSYGGYGGSYGYGGGGYAQPYGQAPYGGSYGSQPGSYYAGMPPPSYNTGYGVPGSQPMMMGSPNMAMPPPTQPYGSYGGAPMARSMGATQWLVAPEQAHLRAITRMMHTSHRGVGCAADIPKADAKAGSLSVEQSRV
eukprot:CAMPEP_0178453570 /NCGR_PEP_ID=MMETSP0689_2-20121128/44883_1 /TAXON_ID=160604 /ORGANISM="Amphidinium massartii, Strain CS-259" /LENGTH=151 /DNA_ID=CAMNT_0020079421 /DNA_START=105 /DNA_END=561 /DNA_ORIENTATION=+